MMTKIHEEFVFICDGCEDELETNTKNFDEARTTLKDNNWVTAKIDEE